MRNTSFIYRLFAVLGLVFSLAACTDEGPMEKAGKSMDNAAEEAGQKLDDAAEDTKDAVKEECEKLKESMNADDTDC